MGGERGTLLLWIPYQEEFQKRNETSLDMDTDRTMDVTRFNIQRTSQENVNYLYIIQSVLYYNTNSKLNLGYIHNVNKSLLLAHSKCQNFIKMFINIVVFSVKLHKYTQI